ncbi:hypothetical protein PPERSA_07980 [Pseudocohnilembus persalinus]|uniref:Uncharacterized protein n=1 Tax=Pseudocohnilembus persalinus TaxID=266149 RepID=A0A0V0QBN3_PSEPJ|nr:hypothetical protein PPERSA_07980 [Pseudocohnilembus persalinus]|eukprot:KRW99495.1 hypothetical protein PPERSA_07980 [Pseudocohnilembus persalinus]
MDLNTQLGTYMQIPEEGFEVFEKMKFNIGEELITITKIQNAFSSQTKRFLYKKLILKSVNLFAQGINNTTRSTNNNFSESKLTQNATEKEEEQCKIIELKIFPQKNNLQELKDLLKKTDNPEENQELTEEDLDEFNQNLKVFLGRAYQKEFKKSVEMNSNCIVCQNFFLGHLPKLYKE